MSDLTAEVKQRSEMICFISAVFFCPFSAPASLSNEERNRKNEN
jgi:hypothetical protein